VRKGSLTLGYGYAVGELKFPKIPISKPDVKFKRIYRSKYKKELLPINEEKKPQQFCFVNNFNIALPYVDTYDIDTCFAGALRRFCCQPPIPIPGILDELESFVYDFVRENFSPIPSNYPLGIFSLESFLYWLSKTNYTEKRKAELRRSFDKTVDKGIFYDRIFQVNSFIKREHYLEFKHARSINARSDEFKTVVGPYFKAMEEIVFQYYSFIKKIPVRDRPQFIMSMYDCHPDCCCFVEGDDGLMKYGGQYIATDFKSYETHFTKELMMSCEFVLYKYMLSECVDGLKIYEYLVQALTTVNRCVFKNFVIKVPATRMSGEMNTSLGNGFSNLMFFLFLVNKHNRMPTVNDYLELGLTIELDLYKEPQCASFCGIVFDIESLTNITNPYKALLSLLWNDIAYVDLSIVKLFDLMYCKALSLVHQYPGCPVLQSLGLYILRMIHGDRKVRRIFFSNYTFTVFNMNVYGGVPARPVNITTRLLMEEKFGMCVSVQLLLEEYFDHKVDFDFGDFPLSVDDFPYDIAPYSKRYIHVVERRNIFKHSLTFPKSLALLDQLDSDLPEEERVFNNRPW